MIIVFTEVIFPDYLIPKVISDYLSIAFREKLMITVAKHMDYISDYTIPGYPLRRASQTVQKLMKLPRCIFTVAERKQSKAVISFEEWLCNFARPLKDFLAF